MNLDADQLPPRPPSAGERVLLGLGIVALTLVCLVVTYTVVARAVGLPLIPDDVQIVRQFMVAVIVFPMAAVTAARMHIAVTVFSNWLTATAKRRLTVAGGIAGLLLASLLLSGAVGQFADSLNSGEYFEGDIRIPYWISHGVYTIALSALWLRMLAMICIDFRAVLAQDESP